MQIKSQIEKLRLDKFLWFIRLFKTRTLAATACDTGKVKFKGTQAKAAKHVTIGDEFEVKNNKIYGASIGARKGVILKIID